MALDTTRMDAKERLAALKRLATIKELDEGFPSQRACIDWSNKVAPLLRFHDEYYREFTEYARFINQVGLSGTTQETALNNMISVVRRAAVDLEAGPLEQKETSKVSSMKLKERVENHPVVFFLTALVVGFAAGFGVAEKLHDLTPRQDTVASHTRGPEFLEERIRQLTEAHDKRLAELQAEYLSEQREAVNHGSIDSFRENHRRAAEHIGQQIDKENSSFLQQISALRGVTSK